MPLKSVIGDVGGGKTLFTTYIASKYDKEKTVFANYKLDLPNYKDLKPETLVTINEKCLIIIDEAYNWLESRLSGRDINLYMSYILFQSRKRGMDIYLTDQLAGSIDLRYRMLTNYEIHCESIPEGFKYTFHKVNCLKQYKPVKLIMPYEFAETLFPIYDSWELIDPIDDDLINKISVSKINMKTQVKEITKILLKNSPAKTYTKGIVEHYCLENELPKSLINPIYNSIKASQINLS